MVEHGPGAVTWRRRGEPRPSAPNPPALNLAPAIARLEAAATAFADAGARQGEARAAVHRARTVHPHGLVEVRELDAARARLASTTADRLDASRALVAHALMAAAELDPRPPAVPPAPGWRRVALLATLAFWTVLFLGIGLSSCGGRPGKSDCTPDDAPAACAGARP